MPATFRAILGVGMATAMMVGAFLGARAGAPGAVIVTAQLLDYEKGYVFFTTGDGFRIAPNVQIDDISTGKVTAQIPAPRMYARVTFDSSGAVTKIELSAKFLAAEGDLSQVARYAVSLSKPQPDLKSFAIQRVDQCTATPGKPVVVIFEPLVPPSTSPSDNVYLTTDQSGWNPQAYRLTRVDALHYRLVKRFNPGTLFYYLYDRGSAQSIERGQNGLDRAPTKFCVGNADVQNASRQVYHWADENLAGTQGPVPQAFPTPYNPAPFPNLPPTPHP